VNRFLRSSKLGNKLVDLRDARFILYEQLGVEDLCVNQRFQDHSIETFDMILDAAEKLAVKDFAPVNKEGDEVGCIWQGGVVKIPPGFHGPFKKYCEGGWISMADDIHVGGQQVPLSVNFVCQEMFFAANHSLSGYMGLTHSAAKVVEVYGTEEQRQKFMKPLYEGRSSGTMVLTEAQAGSDVGNIRVKAVRLPDGSYALKGGKIFITGGEHNLAENIIHIVLARIEGDPEGPKGLSCFVLPKLRVDDNDGSLVKNDVACTGIEHKMGMNGSATCVLSYGDHGGCRGEILGPEREGIIVMFHMMNEQRVLVGLQGLAQASTAYLHALDFARDRKQGSEFGKQDLKQVPIINHPDVRRDLLWMKCYTEGMRALLLYTVHCIDRTSDITKEKERSKWQNMVEVLTPICKAFCTKIGFDVCTRAIQVHGGYGYCREYRVEQFARDCKVTSIYEGTNGIQAIDLFRRKIRMRDGSAFKTVIGEMRDEVEQAAWVDGLTPYAQEVGKSISNFVEITGQLVKQVESEEAYLAHSWAMPYLESFGDIVLGWMFLWQVRIAYDAFSKGQGSQRFYESKIHTAKFYIGSLLPVVYGKMEAMKRNEKSFMMMGESIFPS